VGARASQCRGIAVMLVLVVSLLSVGALSGCGGGSGQSVATVGKEAISKQRLAHWMTVVAAEGVVPDPPSFAKCVAREKTIVSEAIASVLKQQCRSEYNALNQQAFTYLIESRWLLREASAEGLGSGDGATPAGPGGVSGADLSYERKVGFAADRVVERLRKRQPPISEEQVARYYRLNLRQFERPEHRFFKIAEGLPTAKAAKREMMLFAAHSPHAKIPGYESLYRGTSLSKVAGRESLVAAVFLNPPGKLVGPIPFAKHYAFFEVTKIIPRLVRPLRSVRLKIQNKLLAQESYERLVAFIAAWRRKWTARTECSAGYTIQKCAGYSGATSVEDPATFLSGFTVPEG
jgi:hypothetical protein